MAPPSKRPRLNCSRPESESAGMEESAVGSSASTSDPERRSLDEAIHRPTEMREKLIVAKMLELFVGARGLTKAVQQCGQEVYCLSDFCDPGREEFSLRSPRALKKLLRVIREGGVRWLHINLRVDTFQVDGGRTRRNGAMPDGVDLADPRTKRANEEMKRIVRLCNAQLRVGGWFSLENPTSSWCWKAKPVVLLNANTGVSRVDVQIEGSDGGETWLTNAPWMNRLGQIQKQLSLRSIATAYDVAVRNGQSELQPEHPSEVLLDEGCIPHGESSRRRIREKENVACIGGLRNPNSSVARIPGWADAGLTLRRALEEAIGDDKKNHGGALGRLVNGISDPNFSGETEEELRRVRRYVAAALGAAEPSFTDGLCPEIVDGLQRIAGDPDVDVAEWARGHTPLGVSKAIPARGVFPVIPEEERAKKKHESYRVLEAVSEFQNYKSFAEAGECGAQELNREEQAKFLKFHDSLAALTEYVGRPAVLSRIAVIIKTRANGTIRVRLVHDLRRSGGNGLVTKYEERVVLPRLIDAVNDALSMLRERSGPHERVWLFTLDFKDAFKSLRLDESERFVVAGKAGNRFFSYETVLFGVLSGPLVWGRFAAFVMRASQAMLRPGRGRLQCYVDDPIAALRGTEAEIRHEVLLLLLAWRAIGLWVAWGKGSLGESVDWVGARIGVDWKGSTVSTTIPEDKVSDLQELGAKLADARGMFPIAEARTYAGKTSWVAGMIPQLRPFVAQVCGAVADASRTQKSKPSTRKRPERLMFARRCASALQWLHRFWEGVEGTLTRTFRADQATAGVQLVTDASPWGGGAVIWSGGPGPVGAAETKLTGQPLKFFKAKWTEDDAALVRARIGDPADQTTWELFTILPAVWLWREELLKDSLTCVLRTDNVAALVAAVELKAKADVLRMITQELALLLAPSGHSVERGVHLRGEHNDVCDYLSRLFAPGVPAPAPTALRNVMEVCVPRRREIPWRILDFVGE